MTDLTLIFAAGFVGSAHCIGMCGGFVLAIANSQDRPARLQLHQAAYFTGKTLTYVLLGALAGGLGHVLGASFSVMQNVLSVVAGLAMILIGLGLTGVLRRFEGNRLFARVPGLQQAMAFFLRRSSLGGTLGLGLLNGLLPCGLVYGLLAKAASTGTVSGGALTMAVFGIATVPALYVLGLSGFLMQPLWRARLNLVSGIIVIALGLITLVRGTPFMDDAMRILGGHDPTEHQMEQPPPGTAPSSAPADTPPAEGHRH